jgi:hypothetical protein
MQKIPVNSKILFCGSLAILAFIATVHESISPAYGRCTEEDVRTGNCRLPDNVAPSLASANQTVLVTQATLQECSDLGIKPEKCSEQAILGKYCLGPNEACNPVHVPIDVNINLIPIYVGIVVAFVAGIFYVRRTGRWKTGTL